MKCQVDGCIREARTSYALCDTDTYRALTHAFGPRASTGAELGSPLPSSAPAEARPSRTGALSPNSGNLARASG